MGRRYNAGMDGSDPMASTAHSDRRLTHDDFLLFPEGDGLRHEIIDGVHYVTAAPNLRHRDLMVHDIVEPDLVFVAADQLAIMAEKNIQGAPAIVVEVVSTSTRRRDERIKKELFDRGGVREYWIVDPDRSRVIVHRRNSAGFDARTHHAPADDAVLTSPLLPGFSLSIPELFKPTP
jgi:Putative restriction endonuclease